MFNMIIDLNCFESSGLSFWIFLGSMWTIPPNIQLTGMQLAVPAPHPRRGTTKRQRKKCQRNARAWVLESNAVGFEKISGIFSQLTATAMENTESKRIQKIWRMMFQYVPNRSNSANLWLGSQLAAAHRAARPLFCSPFGASSSDCESPSSTMSHIGSEKWAWATSLLDQLLKVFWFFWGGVLFFLATVLHQCRSVSNWHYPHWAHARRTRSDAAFRGHSIL